MNGNYQLSRLMAALAWAVLTLINSSCQATASPVATPTPDPAPTSPQSADPKCPATEVRAFLDQTEGLLRQFDELVRQAETTSATELRPLIEEMEALAHQVIALPQPTCVLQAQSTLNDYFGHMIQGHFRLHAAALDITPRAEQTATDEFLAAADKRSFLNKLQFELESQIQP